MMGFSDASSLFPQSLVIETEVEPLSDCGIEKLGSIGEAAKEYIIEREVERIFGEEVIPKVAERTEKLIWYKLER